MSVNYTTTFVCDRCGATSRYEMKQVSFSIFSITRKYDLCRGCIEGFEKWLKNEAVIHAHWTDDEECSNCGCYKLFEKAADRYMFWRSESAFCPSCGAIMDEEEDG